MSSSTRYRFTVPVLPVVSLADSRFPHVTTPRPNATRAREELTAHLRHLEFKAAPTETAKKGGA